MTEIYNLDKVERSKVKARFDNKNYYIKEPTVSDFVKISKLKLEEIEGQLDLVKVLCPALFKRRWFKKPVIETLTLAQRNLLVELAFQVVSGGKGKIKLEEIQQ
ncbi:MAG: hypothetical protein ACRCUS_07570 [Anaerovoracaceae bacterium]